MSNKKKNKKKEALKRIIAVLILIGITVGAYYFISNLKKVRISNEECSLYQYVTGKKVEYSGILEISSSDRNNTDTDSRGELIS